MKIATYRSELTDERLPVLVKEKEVSYDGRKALSPQDIVDIMESAFRLSKQAEEYVYLLCFNTKMRPIAIFEVSHGTSDATWLRPKEILTKALYAGADTIAIVHNHPSGEPVASKEDNETNKRLDESCKIIGMTYADFIIVGDGRYTSYREEGIIRREVK